LQKQATLKLSKQCLEIGIMLVAVFMAGCAAAPTDSEYGRFEPLPGNPRIVLMPPDIRYYLMTAGGTPVLHDEWTAAAEQHFSDAMASLATELDLDITVLERSDSSELVLRYEGLHAAVGEAVITHLIDSLSLPSQSGNSVSNWTLGPGVSDIGSEQQADYGLFVHYRENQPSGGRIAFAILAAAAKISIPTGSEHGFASLIDLRTGDIAWFGILFDDGTELREPEGASHVASQLLNELPIGGSFARAHESE